MDTQKIFLLIAIFLTVLLLWNKWEVNQTVDDNGNIINQTSIVTAESQDNSTDVPEVSDVPSTVATNIEDTTPLMNESIDQGPYTTVTTDLLTLQISHKGGTIINAWLRDYPIELNSEKDFQLLSNNTGSIFQAQSGLLPADQMPTQDSEYTSEQQDYSLGDRNELIVPLTWKGNNGIVVTKNYHFKPNSYIVEVDYQITNNSNIEQTVSSYTQLVRNSVDESGGMFGMRAYSGAVTYNDEEIFEKIDFEDFDSTPKTVSKGGWAAMLQHYFFTAWIPNENEKHTYSTRSNKDKYLLSTVSQSKTKIAPGNQVTLTSSQLYIGPKEHARLELLSPGLDRTVDYGFLYIVAKPLSVVLHWINGFIGNWALSIIAITFLIKLAFYKLSEKSYRSMAGMKKLAPRLQKIKETYGDDKQKIGKKTMELYKQEKVNPAAGCLPILVQIPVFISIYWVLIEMVELRQFSFLYIPDLSSRDPFFILPLIMGASMWFQQRLNPPPADPMQAKIMMMLPIIFTIFFLWFPAGLVIYWVTNNLLSIAQQVFINKRINKT
jgi:YidC/Oxa1 family membrane protein insertase